MCIHFNCTRSMCGFINKRACVLFCVYTKLLLWFYNNFMHQASEASSKSIKNQHEELHMRPTLRCTSADGEERRDFLWWWCFIFLPARRHSDPASRRGSHPCSQPAAGPSLNAAFPPLRRTGCLPAGGRGRPGRRCEGGGEGDRSGGVKSSKQTESKKIRFTFYRIL